MGSTYLMKELEINTLEKNGINYYFYDAESILAGDIVDFPVEVYFEDNSEENKAMKLLGR